MSKESVFVRPVLEINLGRILENYLNFSKTKASATTDMASVVKDNAYGLGDQEVTKVLYEKGNCHTFFVAHGFEGSRIRSMAPSADIYVLQGPGREDLACFKNDNLIPVINSPQQLALWLNEKPNNQKPALQIETGLNRLGLRPSEIACLTQEQKESFGLVLSHLACADEPKHGLNIRQLENFNQLRLNFPKAKFSLAASDGFLLGESYQFDIVRLGAVLYGLNPVENPSVYSKNVIKVMAPIIQIAHVNKGDTAGYGAEYTFEKDGKVAIISIGYGDGVFRSFFPKGKVWLEQEDQLIPVSLAGRVSMDNLICDVSDIQYDILMQNQYVTLINDSYTADDFGKDAGTIGYEVISALGHGTRYVRNYITNSNR